MSSFGLKILALILMVIDHIAQFLPGMPIWMHWIGRLAAPFLSIVVSGALHIPQTERNIF